MSLEQSNELTGIFGSDTFGIDDIGRRQEAGAWQPPGAEIASGDCSKLEEAVEDAIGWHNYASTPLLPEDVGSPKPVVEVASRLKPLKWAGGVVTVKASGEERQ